jgi:hypothetical protein
MAIVINTAPGTLYSAHGDLLFVVYEATKANDPVTYPDYKYVADVYIGTTQVARIKKVPQPDNKRGVFNIGDVVRNYMALAFNPDATQLRAQELALNEFFLDVTVKFGEEYNFVTYLNLVTDSTRRYFNHYNGRTLGNLTALPPFLDKVVSNRPYAGPISPSDNFSFLPYLPSTDDPFDVVITKYGGTSGASPTTISWGYFDTDPLAAVDTATMQFSLLYPSGTNSFSLNFTNAANLKWLVLKEASTQPVKTSWINTIFNYGTMPDSVFRAPVVIGAFRYYVSREPVVLDATYPVLKFDNGSTDVVSPIVTASFTVTITPSEAFALQILNLAPGLINQLMPGFIDSATIYYTIQIGATSVYRYNVGCELRFTVWRLHFLNQYGGFESRDFTKVSRKGLAITKSDFGKLPYTIGSDGSVSYSNSNKVYNEMRSTYASQYNEKYTLNSDILTDDEYTWLAQLVLSPLVYFEQNGYFIPVAIVASNYQFNKVVNDKLTVLTVEVQFGEQYNAQYR